MTSRTLGQRDRVTVHCACGSELAYCTPAAVVSGRLRWVNEAVDLPCRRCGQKVRCQPLHRDAPAG